MTEPNLGDYVDLEQYPIDQLDSAVGEQLIRECHKMIQDESICALPGFLRSTAVEALAAEISDLEQVARKVRFVATPYGWMDNAGFPDDHPRSQLFDRNCSAITTEQFKESSRCIALFEFDEITDFVRRLLQYDALYRSACPNISVRINIMDRDDEFGWHYDTNDGVVSFSIQDAEEGGVFEYAPLIRSEESENYSAVKQIMAGEVKPHQAHTPPGTFVLFMGRRSLHRVSRVTSSGKGRYSLLFSYDRQPGMVFPKQIRDRLVNPTSEPFLGAKSDQ